MDLATGQPFPGVQGRACSLADVDCTQPVVESVAASRDGWFDFPLYEGFTGYIELTGDGLVPGMMYLTEPLTADTKPGYPYLLLTTDARDALSRVLNVTVDPGAGIIALRSFDCQGVTAPDVTLNKPGPGTPWYFVSGLPIPGAQKTGSEGFGGYINAPPGVALVDALTPDGVSIGGTLSLVVRPGWSSTTFLHPPGAAER